MAAGNMQKLKLLNLMDILRAETDPDHGLSMPQILEKLENRGISAERKSIYADIETLRAFGIDIRKYQRQPVEYALAERDFELPELMLLIDAVQSSRFLSEGKSKALVKSIRSMASTSEKHVLNKQVHVHGRPRSQTQSDFNIVDKIQDAMSDKKKISFQYYCYDTSKKKVARKNGQAHIGTPVCLTYSDDNYYLVAYSDTDQQIRNYRVDRMGCVEKLAEKAEKNDDIRNYDANEVGKCAFGMFGGDSVTVTLVADESVMNVIVDRFGQDVQSQPIENGTKARITAKVMKSPVFFGWIAQMKDKVTIEKPTSLRREYVSFLEDIVKAYQ